MALLDDQVAYGAGDENVTMPGVAAQLLSSGSESLLPVKNARLRHGLLSVLIEHG